MVALVKETKGEVFIKAIEEAKNNKFIFFPCCWKPFRMNILRQKL